MPRTVRAMAHNTLGAGKTTLLNALGGRATYGEVSGHVTLGGRPLTSQDLNYVPQFDDHNERFSPRELLTYMKHLQVRLIDAERERRTAAYLIISVKRTRQRTVKNISCLSRSIGEIDSEAGRLKAAKTHDSVMKVSQADLLGWAYLAYFGRLYALCIL